MSRISDLRNLILKAKHAYYYSGEPIMSDAEYDALEDELRLLAPNDPLLALVGAPVSAEAMLTKARHAILAQIVGHPALDAGGRIFIAKSAGDNDKRDIQSALLKNGKRIERIISRQGIVGQNDIHIRV